MCIKVMKFRYWNKGTWMPMGDESSQKVRSWKWQKEDR